MIIFNARSKIPDEDGDTGITIREGHIFASMLIGLIIYTTTSPIMDFLHYLWLPNMGRERSLLAGGFLALLGGAILFAFRLKYRAIYGLSEATVGVLIAAQRFAEPTTNEAGFSFFIVFLTAGIYLVVRGMDNIHQGITKPPLDPLAAKFINRTSTKNSV
jgi:hypothetical protein